MDVTAANFRDAAELLESLLPSCSFYAIDAEMTFEVAKAREMRKLHGHPTPRVTTPYTLAAVTL